MTIKPDLKDYRELLKALNVMDDAAKIDLKNEVYSISSWVAKGIAQAASGHQYYPKQAEIVAQTIRPARDRLPTIYIGGSKGRASGGANAGQLLFGNEFGGDRNAYGNKTAFPNGGFKFPPRTDREGRGNVGYWIFPTLKGMQKDILEKWKSAATKVMDNWARS
jgi:hypothetical protein